MEPESVEDSAAVSNNRADAGTVASGIVPSATFCAFQPNKLGDAAFELQTSKAPVQLKMGVATPLVHTLFTGHAVSNSRWLAEALVGPVILPFDTKVRPVPAGQK